jgi:hypothetical protein
MRILSLKILEMKWHRTYSECGDEAVEAEWVLISNLSPVGAKNLIGTTGLKLDGFSVTI